MESPGQNPYQRRRIDRRAIWLTIAFSICMVFLYTFFSASGLSGYQQPENAVVSETTNTEAQIISPSTPTTTKPSVSQHETNATLAPAGSRIVRCTALIGDRNEAYEALLKTQLAYNHKHGYLMEIFRNKVVDGMWNKDAAIMTTLLDHLSKPKSAGRYDWLVWSDADVAIMNPELPLTAYLPPSSKNGDDDEGDDPFADVHLIYSSDPVGLNAGIFFLRISEWSVNYLSAILAYRSFRPDEDLPYAEQDAMGRLLELPSFGDAAVELPEKSLSVYPDGDWAFEPGQLMLHFAGQVPKEDSIWNWLEKLEAHPEEYTSVAFAEEFEVKMREWWGKKAEERAEKKQKDQEEKERKEKEEEEKKEKEEHEKEKEEEAKEKAEEKTEMEEEKAKEAAKLKQMLEDEAEAKANVPRHRG